MAMGSQRLLMAALLDSERMFDVSLRLEPAVFHACLSEGAEARQSSHVNITQAFVSSFTCLRR